MLSDYTLKKIQYVRYVKFHTRKLFILGCGSNVVVLLHLLTYFNILHQLCFGISIDADVIHVRGENMTADCKLPVCQSVVNLLQVCQSVIASCQSASCMSVSNWQVCSLQRQVAFLPFFFFFFY